MSFNLDSHLSIHATALVARSQRATVLANNLANADTPGYKARDISFNGILSQQTYKHIPLTGRNPGHIDTPRTTGAATSLVYRQPTQTSQDDNTVQTDVEKGEFTENAIRYQASLQFMKSRVNGMIKAIRSE